MEINYNDFKEMTAEQTGIELLGRCIETYVEDNPNETFVKPTLKIMGITYSVQVPRDEANLKGFVDAYLQIIELFGATHLSGQATRVKNQGLEISEIKPLIQ